MTIEVDNIGPTVMQWSKMRHFQTENSVFVQTLNVISRNILSDCSPQCDNIMLVTSSSDKDDIFHTYIRTLYVLYTVCKIYV